jgi:hypothetical protein
MFKQRLAIIAVAELFSASSAMAAVYDFKFVGTGGFVGYNASGTLTINDATDPLALVARAMTSWTLPAFSPRRPWATTVPSVVLP